MREFFGFGGYSRPVEGYLSWQHLLFATALTTAMIALAVILGIENRKKSNTQKNKVLIVSAILIDTLELFKIILMCFRSQDPMNWVYNLPLFLCSIQLITIPMAAFCKGRVREASLDFVCIFGMLGAILGTYAAGNNYAAYPVLSFDNVISGLTHCISGFAALYILIAGMASMKKRNIGLTFTILMCFCVAAYIANVLVGGNYMFLMGGDGTPYDILYNLLSGHKVLYPLSVAALFLLYIGVFYQVYYAVCKKRQAALPK